MKAKLSFLVFSLFAFSTVMAQDNSDVYNYFNGKIDEAVQTASDLSTSNSDVDSNPVYAKLFVSPVLYQDVIEEAFTGTETMESGSNAIAMDDNREEVISDVLMGMYRDAPAKVEMTEEELRTHKMVNLRDYKIKAPEIKFPRLAIPEDVVGGMKTTVVKPNYWSFSGNTSLTFTQSFISDNWYQGGEKNYFAMLATIDLDVNYNDNNRISWTNHFDFDLGFATYQKENTKLGMKTNTDKLRLESTFGYKLVKSLDLAAKVKVETQSLPYYNGDVMQSAFISPLDANASVGLNYKPDLGNFKIEFYLAPFSGYNFRYVRHDELLATYGLEKHYTQDFGTQLVVTIPTYQLTSFLDVYSRLEYYTNYHRVFFQWETKFNVALSKYFTASLMLNTRFDDSAARDVNWQYWQLKELFTLGVAYKW